MTTKVTISSPANNHQNVRVEGRYIRADELGRPVPHMGVEPYYVETLSDGQSTTLYVHDSACVVIREVAKLRETGKPQNSEIAQQGAEAASQGGILQPDELPAPGQGRRFDHEDRPIVRHHDEPQQDEPLAPSAKTVQDVV